MKNDKNKIIKIILWIIHHVIEKFTDKKFNNNQKKNLS